MSRETIVVDDLNNEQQSVWMFKLDVVQVNVFMKREMCKEMQVNEPTLVHVN